MFKINDRQAINAIRDVLRNELEDPRAQYTSASRTWIHTDDPLSHATYPRVKISKRGPTQTEIMSMGMTNFGEWKTLILDIDFLSESPFKWDSGSGVYLQDEELGKEYLSKIWDALKADHTNLRDTYGITGLKNMGEEEPYLQPDTQLYSATISVRFWYFTLQT